MVENLHVCKIRFIFVNDFENAPKTGLTGNKGMKDRIRKVMESQHMTQQNFAQFIGVSTAALSSIFNGRTKATLNTVEAIRSKLPDINIEWLIFGTGDMFLHDADPQTDVPATDSTPEEQVLEFDMPANPLPDGAQTASSHQGVNRTLKKSPKNDVKIFDKLPRRVTEIRVFYDDQTYESFVPKT
jgi:transcriptional regulator with XRE-family HTH domain